MPLTDIETGRLLQQVDELVRQMTDLNNRMILWQPIVEEAQKQQSEKRSITITLSVAAILGFSLFFVTAATWYIRSGNPVPYNTIPQIEHKG